MAIPLSLDLRKRVCAAIESGKSRKKTAKLFQITESVICKWLSLKEKTGSLKAKTGYQTGPTKRIQNDEEFKKFVLANRNCSLKELAQKHGGASPATIGRALKNIGFSKKKDFWIQRTR